MLMMTCHNQVVMISWVLNLSKALSRFWKYSLCDIVSGRDLFHFIVGTRDLCQLWMLLHRLFMLKCWLFVNMLQGSIFQFIVVPVTMVKPLQPILIDMSHFTLSISLVTPGSFSAFYNFQLMRGSGGAVKIYIWLIELRYSNSNSEYPTSFN